MKRLLKKIQCFFAGHKYSSWKYPNEMQKYIYQEPWRWRYCKRCKKVFQEKETKPEQNQKKVLTKIN